MEWVEVTGRTVEEAKDAALDQLGVDEADAEFEVLEVPKGGLFGRLRSEARVRARVLPTAPRPKVERRDRRRSGGSRPRPARPPSAAAPGRSKSDEPAPRRSRPKTEPKSEQGASMSSQETTADGAEVAESFVQGLLEVFGVDSKVERRELEGDTVELAVDGPGLGLLIGQRGQTLAAVQELARTVVQRRAPGYDHRIVVDVGGYRQARREALARFATTAAEQVLASGVPRVLEPMPPADRKVVHDTINEISGVVTSSEGEEPRRRVVISPDADAD